MAMSSDDKYLIITPDSADGDGAYGHNTVYYIDLAGDVPATWQRRPLIETFNAEYRVITKTLR